jgi:hypothetical protein
LRTAATNEPVVDESMRILSSPWWAPAAPSNLAARAPHVNAMVYELTALGHSLAGPITAITAWAEEHMRHITRARDRYDRRAA